MKIVAVYFSDPEPYGYPLNALDMGRAYNAVAQACAKEGIEMRIVRTQSSYMGNMRFSHGWRLKGESVEEIKETFTADLIYMKSRAEALKTTPGDKLLNDTKLDSICRDKLACYNLFSELMKPCVPITQTEWRDQISKLREGRIVLKPVFGEGGDGIIFTNKSDFEIQQIPVDIPYLAQEFVESEAGVPGIATGRHDLRVIMANEKPVVSYVRLAKEGSFISNISQGASVVPIEIKNLPQACIDIAQKVDKEFQKYPFRFYSIDFMFEAGKPYIVELNSRPGLHTAEFIGAKHAQNLINALVSVFKLA